MKTFQEWLKEAMVVGRAKAGTDYQVAGTGSPGMKKMSGFGNPGGIAVPKGEK